MQEHQVTAAGVRHVLEEPFYVLATRNPIEMEGTHLLPEAQLDRFMFNVVMNYLPEEDEEVAVIQQTTERKPVPIEPIFTGEDVLRFNDLARSVPISKNLARTPCALIAALPTRQPDSPAFVNDWVSWGRRNLGRPIPRPRCQSPRTAARPHGTSNPRTFAPLSCPRPAPPHPWVNYRAEAEGTCSVADVL